MKKCIIIPYFILLVVILYIRCTDNVSGNVTQTGNAIGILYNPNGSRAANAKVYIVSVDHNPKPIRRIRVIDSTITDDTGGFVVDSVPEGYYNILGSGDSGISYDDSIFIDNDTIPTEVTDTLRESGTLRGVVRLQGDDDSRTVFILVFGTQTWTAPIDSIGNFTLANMAEGTYHVRLLTTLDDYDPLDTNLTVFSGVDTTINDTLYPPFTGIPTPTGLTMSYDTLNQIVLLSWNAADTSLIIGYKVYRRSDTTVQFSLAIDSILSDTFFIDNIINGLEKGETYEYMIRAVDADENEGPNSKSVTIRIAFYVDAGNDSTYQLGDTVTLKARIDSNTVAPTEYRFDTDGDAVNEFVSATLDSFKYVYPDTGTYNTVIAIQCSNSTVYTDTVIITIIPKDTSGAPSAPKNLVLSYDTLKQIVTLTWSPNIEADIAGYNIYRRHSDSGLVKINSAINIDTSFSDSSAVENQTYEYKITAVDNADNEGEKSKGVSVAIVTPFLFVNSISQTNLLAPQDIVLSDSLIYVLEYDSAYLFSLDTSNNIISLFKLCDSNNYALEYPTGLIIEEDSVFYIAARNGLFQYYNGKFIKQFEESQYRPNRIAIDNKHIYVTTDHEIVKYDKNGTIISKWGTYGTGTDQIKNAIGITAYSDSMFVCDTDNNRIQIFSTTGVHLGSFGEKGTENGQFDRPTIIKISSNGLLYITDQGNNRVQIFNRHGKYVGKFNIFGANSNTRGLSINLNNIALSVGNSIVLYRKN